MQTTWWLRCAPSPRGAARSSGSPEVPARPLHSPTDVFRRRVVARVPSEQFLSGDPWGRHRGRVVADAGGWRRRRMVYGARRAPRLHAVPCRAAADAIPVTHALVPGPRQPDDAGGGGTRLPSTAGWGDGEAPKRKAARTAAWVGPNVDVRQYVLSRELVIGTAAGPPSEHCSVLRVHPQPIDRIGR